MIKAYFKIIIRWYCPKCGRLDEIVDRPDKSIPDELECVFCGHEEEWELEE